jgi:response regulator RpfG family c-di-GMP phosphodiesterase
MYPENNIPIIMLSAKSSQNDVLAGLDSGCVDYIKKPFLQSELLARVRTQLELRNAWKAQLQASLSNELLQKILPLNIIHRLQNGQKMVADDHPSTSILFSDVVGFTTLASKLPTKQVVLLLNHMFTKFDRLVDQQEVYKVAPGCRCRAELG